MQSTESHTEMFEIVNDQRIVLDIENDKAKAIETANRLSDELNETLNVRLVKTTIEICVVAIARPANLAGEKVLASPEKKITGIALLIGKTLSSIDVSDDKETVTFTTNNGDVFKMYHQQDCCENVTLDDTIGDFSDLLETPILSAEEATNDETSELEGKGEDPESYTWTFYNIRTLKGSVTLKWYGESNGYYSEAVSFEPAESV